MRFIKKIIDWFKPIQAHPKIKDGTEIIRNETIYRYNYIHGWYPVGKLINKHKVYYGGKK